jgi:hypothetical protein
LAQGCGVGLRKACGFPKALTDGGAPFHGVLDHRASEQSKRADLLVALLLKPPAHQLELLPVVGGLDADLLVGKLGNAEFEYVMVDGRVQLR